MHAHTTSSVDSPNHNPECARVAERAVSCSDSSSSRVPDTTDEVRRLHRHNYLGDEMQIRYTNLCILFRFVIRFRPSSVKYQRTCHVLIGVIDVGGERSARSHAERSLNHPSKAGVKFLRSPHWLPVHRTD